jgi:hypothetical protein
MQLKMPGIGAGKRATFRSLNIRKCPYEADEGFWVSQGLLVCHDFEGNFVRDEFLLL